MLLPVLFYFFASITQPSPQHLGSNAGANAAKITVELRLRPNQLKDSGMVSFRPAEYILRPESVEEQKKPKNGMLSITTNSDEPVYLNFSGLLSVNKRGHYLAEPGDEVLIISNGDGFQFSGKGAEKYRLQYQLDSLYQSLPKPSNDRDYYTQSIEDYFEYVNHLRNEFDITLPLVNSYQGKISSYAFELINEEFIRHVLDPLSSKFQGLKKYLHNKKIPVETLVHIYDTSYSKTAEKFISHHLNKETISLQLRRHQLDRIFDFDSSKEIPEDIKTLFLWEHTLKVYKGQMRERIIVSNFPKQLMNDEGFTPGVEKLLAAYYAEPGYPEWKKWMKGQELIMRKRHVRYNPPAFKLTDTKGRLFTKDNLKGKFAVLHFWQSGTKEGTKMAASIKKLSEQFKKYPELVIVNISVDDNRDQWLKAIAAKNLPGIHLYTNGEGVNHDMIREYAVTEYPSVWLIYPNGKAVNEEKEIALTYDNGKPLIDLLVKHMIALPKDGPYVWHNGNASVAYNIKDSVITKKEFASAKPTLLPVQSDLDHTFPVKLQASLTVQPTEYTRPEKLFALSDIEGNFDAFRKLLQRNNIIDQNYNWTFGKGHVVFAGDMFDRGNQVTECLWLLYSLEEKAKTAGGYVHFVLGNHEIMNMQGNHKYVQDKYKSNAALMNKSLTELYNENSELGRWLRTKNVMEKIGDLLFAHGGVSHQVWRMSLTMKEINDLVRPYYGATTIDSSNTNLVILYGSRRTGPEHSYPSPFWFRGYYGDIDNPKEIPTMKQLDSALNKFNVNHIITGHTIIADTVSVHYGGKVINTDTKHADGKSEALLIEEDKFYRVNSEGRRVLLFIDDKRKATGK